MTREEAIEMLRTAQRGEEKSNVNSQLTMTQAVDIVTKGVLSLQYGSTLSDLIEKRVLQVCKNKKRITWRDR